MIDVYRALTKGKAKILTKKELEIFQKNFENIQLEIEEQKSGKYKVRLVKNEEEAIQ